MDEPTKAKIRKRATRRLWIHVPALVVLSGLSLLSRLVPGSLSENLSTHTFLERAALLKQEFARFYWSRSKILATFPPPTCTEERAAWADSIQAAIGQEAAVFIRDGGQLTWICEPDTLRAGMSLIKESFTEEKTQGSRHHPARLGSMERSHWSVRSDTSQPGYHVWTVTNREDNQQWGFAERTEDSWSAFFKMLDAPNGPLLSLEHPAMQLNNFLALPRSKSVKYLTGIRAFYHDRVIFTSPNLDTANICHIEDLKDGRKVEYYQSRLDKIYIQEMNRGRVPWVAVFLPLVFIVPTIRWYRQVRRLTEPMA
jgi:hypothetical protein